IIQQGMIPKVDACVVAINGGVKKTHIIDARTPHGLLLEIFTDKGIGTEIIR
ncbi:MAG: acetylglutamate kinase, partial [Candidatus Omnitrophota bacterium]